MSGFFGNIMNQAMGALGNQISDKIGDHFGEILKGDGLNMLISQAQNAGLEDKVRSWIGSGENLPISSEELRNLLTSDQLQTILSKTGLPAGTILPALAQILPSLVDKHTPEPSDAPKENG